MKLLAAYPRRTCRDCGKRRRCTWYATTGPDHRSVMGSNWPRSFTSSSNWIYWPKVYGWLCSDDAWRRFKVSFGRTPKGFRTRDDKES